VGGEELPTTFRYTGQREEADIGLYYYGARWYDPGLGRWIQPDSIIPEATQGVQAWDRFAYTNNNPITYNDPTGHCSWIEAIVVFTVSAVVAVELAIEFLAPEATRQAWDLVGDWFNETGPETQVFGPEEALTQEVMYDRGMDAFYEAWEESGYEVPFEYEDRADERNEGSLPVRIVKGAGVFVREHIVELGLSTFGLGSQDPEGKIDAVGGTIGSLDRIDAADAGNGTVKITVKNDMGWASATRIPSTNRSIIYNKKRNVIGPGGTIHQEFYWYIPYPDEVVPQ